MAIKEFTYNLEDIYVTASQLLKHLKSKAVVFNGEMGVGKTTLIKALLKAMGSNDSVTSPTFSIVNEYSIPNDKVFHFDFYRIEDIEEAYNFGIEDYLNSDHWLFMEWSERIAPLLPEHLSIIDIAVNSTENRTLKLTIETNNLTEKMQHSG
ncbi:MAG: tRNA (adenosine(37)-N6)-threonylcarbamoyltransferase complex ATPase subunit type 1 TsaE [Winogradskyella sp.]|uniref:tRNA (adenosine(37)-N6)-threonylcarbamoyltransferase complex ATPase subunit type 1 TsaE n=1 Tax=Winogradskyella sp. TaxID=1883156 RepID=UPI000F3AB90C|nr:tRNA (adenosine(37)-N6)-threonylcarbamoyltransferase complex ATPase subunit type 1 TsaE [Winogradskyella sp.]RNC86301.1 MAG: tRNA (adenosine(37)-N6)-threonylcarbamoyltransferase complex ATPase subunit type 1 TsaE [Winogradskyella sp.]